MILKFGKLFILFAISLALIIPTIAAATLAVSINSDTASFAQGEVLNITAVDEPSSPITITVYNATNHIVFSSSSLTNSNGSLTILLNTTTYSTGTYRAHVVSGFEVTDVNFSVQAPLLQIDVTPVSQSGAAYSAPASVYYYYNGTMLNLMVNVTAPNNHFTINADLSSLGFGNIMLDPAANATFARGSNANGSGWYAFMLNESIPANFTFVDVYSITFNGSIAGTNATNAAEFLVVTNVQPSSLLSYLSGSTTDWRGIEDFTNISGLVFERVDGTLPLSKIVFAGLNLCDTVTAYSLLNLSSFLMMESNRVAIDPLALPALNASATIYLYNLTGFSSPGILRDGVPAVMVGYTSGDHVSGILWNGTNKNLQFNVSMMGNYVADGSAPFLISSTPTNGAYVNASNLNLALRVNDTISGINSSWATYQLESQNGTAIISGSSVNGWTVSFPVSGLVDGMHTGYVKVVDNVGNMVTLSVSFSTDTQNPVFTTTIPSSNGYTNSTTPTLGANYYDNVSGVVAAKIFVDGFELVSVISYSASGISGAPSWNLSEGSHLVRVEVTDLVGHTNSIMWNFTVDLTLPVIVYFHPDRLMIVPLNDSIYVNYNDNYGISAPSVKLIIDGIEVTNISDVSSREVLYWPAPPLSKGSHNVSFYFRDLAGNEQTASWVFVVDDRAPTFGGTQPSNGTSLTSKQVMVSTNIYDNLQVNDSTINVKIDGRDYTSQCKISEFGVSYFSVTLNTTLQNGQHILEIAAEDTSNNVGFQYVTFSIVEPTGPSAAMIQDLITVAIIMIVVVVILLVVFGRSKRKRADLD
ncbi:MAG: hypothetical protein LUP94_02575 [Candidatus Methanomethylicus sp.]|nr:hypothetical protein [Candidatus Methanomethylicus sp.]